MDNKSATETAGALIVAVFTVSVEDEEIVKADWEKSMKHEELSQHIDKLHKTNQIMSQVSVEKVAIKPGSIGRLKPKHKEEKVNKKKAICIRCLESWSKSHMEKCTAKNITLSFCKKQ